MDAPVFPQKLASQQNLWRFVGKLLRMQWKMQISGFRRAKLRRKIGYGLITLVLLAFLGFVFYLSWMLLKFISSPDLVEYLGDTAQNVISGMPVLLVSGSFIGILMTSFGVLLQVLYLAGDMDFLLSKPVPMRAVFISKLLQAILPNFGLVCLFALPVLFGLGVSQSYSWLFYPLVILTLIALALAAAGISSLLVMLVVRIFPARRVAELLGFIGAIFWITCSQWGNLAQMGEPNPEQAVQALAVFNRFNQPWSPIAWAGRGLENIGSGHWLAGSAYLALTFILAGGAFVLTLNTAEKMYYSGWARMQVNAQRKKPRRASRNKAFFAPLVAFLERSTPSALRAIIVKDWLVMRRDLRNMSQLVTPLILAVIYAVMFLRSGGEPPPGQGEAPEWFMQVLSNAMVYGNIGLSLFMSWMLTARLAGMGFSMEGKQYWLLKTAPLGIPLLIGAKFLTAYLPVLLLGWLFLVVIWLFQSAALSILLFSMAVVALSIAGNTGINLAFGIMGANMKWENPRQMQSTGNSCLASLTSFLYLPTSMLLFFAPPIGLQLLRIDPAIGQIVGLLLGGTFNLLAAALPLWWVRKRVPRLGE
jgi:ABC-2 type transport system permease protein